MASQRAVGHRERLLSAVSCAVMTVALGASIVCLPGPAASAATPKATSFAQDTKFFTDVTEADPSLVSYEQKEGNVALQALLTDGVAFCGFLRRGVGIDKALVEEADGATSTETRTSLPLSVTTFNTIESVALLTLCPAKQKLIPASDRAKIRALGKELKNHAR